MRCVLVDVGTHLRLNFLLKLQQLNARGQLFTHPLQALRHVGLFQQRLLLLVIARKVGREKIRQHARLVDVVDDRRCLIGNIGRKLDHALGRLPHRFDQHVETPASAAGTTSGRISTFARRYGSVSTISRMRKRTRPCVRMFACPSALRIILSTSDAVPIGIKVLRIGILGAFVPLRDHADDLVRGEGFIEQAFAFRPANGQWHDRAGKADRPAHRQQRQHLGHFHRLHQRRGHRRDPHPARPRGLSIFGCRFSIGSDGAPVLELPEWGGPALWQQAMGSARHPAAEIPARRARSAASLPQRAERILRRSSFRILARCKTSCEGVVTKDHFFLGNVIHSIPR